MMLMSFSPTKMSSSSSSSSSLILRLLAIQSALIAFAGATAHVRYRGEFSYVLSRFCDGPPPVIVAQCAEQLELDSVSNNEFIECTTINGDDNFQSGIRCVTTCDLTDGAEGCADVYRENAVEIVENKFGSIDFTCVGETSIDARFIWEKPTRDGRCGSGFLNAFNLHMIRMGVYSSRLGDYDYNGNYFESEPIIRGSPNAFGPHEDHVQRHPILKYTAIDGSSTCFSCDVPFQELVVDVDENRLLPEHIDDDDNNGYQTPSAPASAIGPSGTYAIQFEGNWMVSWISTYSCDIVNDAIPTATFTCTNGAKIRLVEALFDTVTCESLNNGSSLRCQDSDFDNYYQFLRIFEFTGIIFECSGSNNNELPGANIVMDPITVNCLYQGVERVRLGLVCDSYRTYHDIYFECGSESLFFTPFFTIEEGSDEIDQYVCYTAAEFPNGRADGDITTAAASIETDWRLSWNIPRECYTGPDLVQVITPAPTSAPTPNPITPTPKPTSSPTPSPTKDPTGAPVTDPVPIPTPKPISSTQSSMSNPPSTIETSNKSQTSPPPITTSAAASSIVEDVVLSLPYTIFTIIMLLVLIN